MNIVLQVPVLIIAVVVCFVLHRCHGRHLEAAHRLALGRVTHWNAVVAFAGRVDALTISHTRLVQLHGRAVLQRGGKHA